MTDVAPFATLSMSPMPRHPHKIRQDDGPPPIPSTVAGISDSAATVGTDAATQTGLAFDTSAHGSTVGGGLTSTESPTSSAEIVPTSSPSDGQSSSAKSSNPIPMGTVIGVCLGALAGLVIFVLIAIWLYRRSGKLARKSRSRQAPLHASRSARAELERSRSRQERWNKLDDDKEDRWETQFPAQTKEVGRSPLPPVEKLTMFKSSPSLHSADKSDTSHQTSGQPTAYDPQLAKELSQPLSRDVAGRVDSTQPLSWDSGTHGSDSILLSLRSKEFSPSGAVSAFPTPQATSHTQSHRWESAEVMHFDDDSVQADDSSTVRNPFTDDSYTRERRKSTNNPFFGASPDTGKIRSRSRSASRTHSRTSSTVSDTNPFSTPETPVPQLPKPSRPMTNETSSSGDYQVDRAMMSLIAALDTTPEQKPGQLRVPSMQSTVTSDDGERVESFSAFPLPPDDVPPSPIIR